MSNVIRDGKLLDCY